MLGKKKEREKKKHCYMLLKANRAGALIESWNCGKKEKSESLSQTNLVINGI